MKTWRQLCDLQLGFAQVRSSLSCSYYLGGVSPVRFPFGSKASSKSSFQVIKICSLCGLPIYRLIYSARRMQYTYRRCTALCGRSSPTSCCHFVSLCVILIAFQWLSLKAGNHPHKNSKSANNNKQDAVTRCSITQCSHRTATSAHTTR